MRASILFFVFFMTACENKVEEASSEEKALEVVVETIKEKELFERLAFAGKLEPKERRGLYAKSSGIITKVYPKLGEKVKKNQKLMEVSPRDVHFQAFNILAPMEGFFTEVLVEVGQRVDQNDNLGVVAKLDLFETTVQASLRDLSYLELGGVVKVVLAEHTKLEKEIQGKVQEIAPVADPVLGTFGIRIEIECTPADPCYESLKAGTYAKVYLKKNLRKGIKVLEAHLVSDNEKAITLVEGDVIKRVEVKLGKNYGDEIEILEGLNPGDRLVTASSRRPKDGDKAVISE